ncbi:lysozyme inhibitor LprI family protein [Tunturibacter empetritectus]|uniref:Lysozyme inhibitor LprI family protein n=1 Tax=Tunturiibacter empetritectus TaxID=3069691 RepID=A0AAU7ZB56_9BACT
MFIARRLIGVGLVVAVAAPLWGQDANGQDKTLVQEDSRLNSVYQQRVAQLRADPKGLTALRKQERDWIMQRDQQCGKDAGCLTQATKAHADYFETQVKQNDPAAKAGSPIPEMIRGQWMVKKVLPTKTIACWDQKQADAMIGTELEYKADSLRWKTTTVRNLGSTAATVEAKQFAEDNSGRGSQSSQVDFSQLGIATPTVQQITIEHPDVTIQDGSAGGSMEMPGDVVMMKDSDRLVFSVCNVYFEADRAGKP